MAHNSLKYTTLRKFIDGSQLTMDYRTAIGIGEIPSHATFRGLGRRTALATTVGGDDLWEGVATNFVYPDMSAGERMTLVSTHANDTAAGSGARTIHIHGLRVGGIEATEAIAMAGVTPVHTVITDWIFIQYIHTNTVATMGNVAAGDITIYRYGDAARIYNIIKAGGNMSLSSHRMVPGDKTFYMDFVKADAVDNKPVSIRLRATCDFEGTLVPNVFIFNENFELYNSSQVLNFNVPRIFPSLCIIKGTAVSTTTGGTASITFSGWVE